MSLNDPPPRSSKPLDKEGMFTPLWAGWFNRLWQSVKSSVLTIAGVYNPTFQSGYVQYTGASGNLAANTNLIFGLALPNPSGTPAPGLLIGSGVPQAWIITDTWGSPGQPGINLGIAAGETAAAGTDNGGQLQLFGGASFGGTGGSATLQGGTSLNGPGGSATLSGGDSTNGAAGDAFVIGGQNGTGGANVQLIMTKINGVAGVLRIRVNSVTLIEIDQFGAIYIAGNPGAAGQKLTSQGPGAPAIWQ